MATIQETEMDVALDLARILIENDGLIPQEEVLAAFPDVPLRALKADRV